MPPSARSGSLSRGLVERHLGEARLPPRKTHLSAAIGLALVENGWRARFTRTTDLAQRLQTAHKDLQLAAALAKLDRHHLLILDDFAYVSKDQAESSVLFELIANHCEGRKQQYSWVREGSMFDCASEIPSSLPGAILCWSGMLLACPVGATSFYVDNGMDRSGNGLTWQSAWKSFAAIDWSAMQPGDIIHISGGTAGKIYSEALVINASGAADAPITITCSNEPGHDGPVTIDGENRRRAGVVLDRRNHIVVQRLLLRNHADAGITVKGATAGVMIEDNVIYSGDPGGGNARGIDIRDSVGMDAVIVRRNRFTTPTRTTAQTDGIWSSGNDGVVLESNWIVIANGDTTGHSDGIQSYRDRNLTIRGNWIEQANPARSDNHGLWLSDTRNGGTLEVYDNIVLTPNLTDDSAVTHWAEPEWQEAGIIRLWNNTIIGGRRGINLDKSPGAEVRNNIIWPAADGFAVAITNGTIPAGNIDQNLLWVPGTMAVASVEGSALNWTAWQARGYDHSGNHLDPFLVDNATFEVMLHGHDAAAPILRSYREASRAVSGQAGPGP